MNRQQADTLLDIISATKTDDHTVEQTLESAMKIYYEALLANREGKTISTLQQEFDKRVAVLRWKLESAFRKFHKQQMAGMNKELAKLPTNEKETLLAQVAKDLKMSPQNLNHHLRNHKEIKIRIESQRKRYISESELNKLKQLLGITLQSK